MHFFKNLIWDMEKEGHEFLLMVKERENTTILMDLLGFEYETFGKTYSGLVGKGFGILHNDFSLLSETRDFAPDITASIGGLYSVHAGRILGVPTIDFTDTENAILTNMLTFPCASVVATPSCYRADVPKNKHLSYRGYHELAYLHPKRFKPDKKVVHELGLKPNDYIVVRYSSLDARHQSEEAVFTRRDKIDLIRLLNEYGEVVVDSEHRLPEPIKQYERDIPDHKFHDILAHSKMYIGEGATTASEAGVLGVPWIYLSKKTRCYLEDQELNYQLGAQVHSTHDAFFTLRSLLEGEVDVNFRTARRNLIKEKIDVTRWMKRLFEHFDR